MTAVAGVSPGSSASAVPPGWTYNPSTWSERLPLVGVAAVGFAIAAYLAAFQLGLVAQPWDPLFGDGSRRVLDSSLSRALPVPDAALGALGYLLDAVSGLLGGTDRWRRRPWLVLLFGIAVGPLGATSIALVVAQPALVGTYCTLCLVSAALSVLMIGPALDEVLASLQHLRRVHDGGGSAWRALWGLEPAAADGASSASPAGRHAGRAHPRSGGEAAR